MCKNYAKKEKLAALQEAESCLFGNVFLQQMGETYKVGNRKNKTNLANEPFRNVNGTRKVQPKQTFQYETIINICDITILCHVPLCLRRPR